MILKATRIYVHGSSRKKGRYHWYIWLRDPKSSSQEHHYSWHFGQGAVRSAGLGVGNLRGEEPSISQAILFHFLPTSPHTHSHTNTHTPDISLLYPFWPWSYGSGNTYFFFFLPEFALKNSQGLQYKIVNNINYSTGEDWIFKQHTTFIQSIWNIILCPSHKKKKETFLRLKLII